MGFTSTHPLYFHPKVKHTRLLSFFFFFFQNLFSPKRSSNTWNSFSFIFFVILRFFQTIRGSASNRWLRTTAAGFFLILRLLLIIGYVIIRGRGDWWWRQLTETREALGGAFIDSLSRSHLWAVLRWSRLHHLWCPLAFSSPLLSVWIFVYVIFVCGWWIWKKVQWLHFISQFMIFISSYGGEVEISPIWLKKLKIYHISTLVVKPICTESYTLLTIYLCCTRGINGMWAVILLFLNCIRLSKLLLSHS